MAVHRQSRGNVRPGFALAIALAALSVGCAAPPAQDGIAPTAKAQAFSAHCSTCHALPHPRRHSYPEWQTLVAVMEQRMRERGMGPLDDRQRRDILAYLKDHGR